MYLKIDPLKTSSALRALIVNYLRGEKIIVYPTDTIYGLGCLATNQKAILKIRRIKKRSANKPFIILVSSLKMAKDYCYISQKQELILKKIWQQKRPTSVILRAKNNLPEEIISKNQTLAVRLPKSNFLRKIIRASGVPLVSTSFNLSGEPVYQEISQALKIRGVDLFLDAGHLKQQASKIIDLTSEALKIIRP